MKTQLRQVKSLRGLNLPFKTCIVMYDVQLRKAVPGFSEWIAKFPHAFSLTAGEKLKSLKSFEKVVERVQSRVGESVTRDWTVVAIGGGSVGDFAGFFASVYRRGLRLVHIPTTWLAAIDSSHGGKTALNLNGTKNQIGTFYPSNETIFVNSILSCLPTENAVDAVGELAKIALIDGRTWTRGLRRPLGAGDRAMSKLLWQSLRGAVDSKLRIVRRDRFETNGQRQILNLGHTFGHALESELGFSHGRSVGLGLLFAIDVSESLASISASRASDLRSWLSNLGIRREAGGRDRLRRARLQTLLRRDKKRDEGNFVWFLVIRRLGKVERRLVDISQILEVAKVYGWLR